MHEIIESEKGRMQNYADVASTLKHTDAAQRAAHRNHKAGIAPDTCGEDAQF